MTVLEIKNVSYAYHTKDGETQALSDVNLTVNKGEFISIVGPSGCGKSSLLSLIAHLDQPEAGSIVTDPTSIGYMLQHDQLFEWRTVYQNIRLGLDIQRKKDPSYHKRIEELLEKYGLLEFKNAKPSELSGGMRQRVALIRTLILEPSLLLLDEPFSALDYQTRLTVSDDISSIIRGEHKTAILVTHDLAEAITVGDVVYVMSKRPGTIISAIPIHFPKDMRPMSRRETPEFEHYFSILWKELSHETA